MALGALPLPGERPHLARDFVHEIVDAREIGGRLFEAALRAAAAVTIEADTGCLFEQLAPVVGTIGEERIDHAALDHDAAVRAESGAAHEVVNVAQAAGCAVQEVLTLAGA